MTDRNKAVAIILAAFLLGAFASGSKLENFGEPLYASWNGFLDFLKPARVHTVYIKDGSFEPKALEIKVNEPVIFINSGESQHQPASNYHPTHEVYPDFDPQKALAPGDKWKFRFDMVGTWYFHDHLNPDIGGKIVVSGRTGLKGKLINRDGKEMMDEIVKLGHDYPKIAVLVADLTRQVGVTEAIKLLNSSGIPPAALKHFLSHKIGETAYEMHQEKALSYCEHDILNGCVHGAIIAASTDIGFEGIIRMVRKCGEISPFKYQMCVHGAGHAFTALSEYDIYKAIDNCNSLTKAEGGGPKILEWCVAGLFMENVHGEHGGLLPFNHPYLSTNDLFYPCTNVTGVYREGCYKNQAGWWYQVFGEDIKRTADYCLKIPYQYRDECAGNVGRLINSKYENNLERIRENCAYLPEPWDDSCIIATARSLLSIGEMESPFPLCAGLKNETSKKSCYTEVVSDISTQNLPEEEFKRNCEKVDGNYRYLCEE